MGDRLIEGGRWIEKKGVAVFNLYKPPIILPGDPEKAGPWIEHGRIIYGDLVEYVVDWLAFRVQFPGVKINCALVLGGPPGIGKDTWLEPLKYAVGAGNFADVSPTEVLGRFNRFLKSIILRVSEARDLGEVTKIAFYNRMKTIIAAPPYEVLIDEKNRDISDDEHHRRHLHDKLPDWVDAFAAG